MTPRPRRTYEWPCPTCGARVTDHRAYRARLRLRCLSCLRAESGWEPPAPRVT